MIMVIIAIIFYCTSPLPNKQILYVSIIDRKFGKYHKLIHVEGNGTSIQLYSNCPVFRILLILVFSNLQQYILSFSGIC